MILWLRSAKDNERAGRNPDDYVWLARQRGGYYIEVVLGPSALDQWLAERPGVEVCILETEAAGERKAIAGG